MNQFKTICEQFLVEKSEKENIANSVAYIRLHYGEQAATALVDLLNKAEYHSELLKKFRADNKTPKPPKPVDKSKFKTPQALSKAMDTYQLMNKRYLKDLQIFNRNFQQLNQDKLDDLYESYETAKKLKIPDEDCQLEHVLGNSKVGDDTIIINMGPATICDAAKAGECDLYTAGFCYAQNNETQHKLALVKRYKQKLQWKQMSSDVIGVQLASAISKKRKSGKPIKYIRFNESGDFSSANDKTKLGKVVESTNAELKKSGEPNVLFYTYTHRADLFKNGNDIGVENLIIQGSGKPTETFFVDNCFMGIDYDDAQRVIAEGEKDGYKELKNVLNLPENEVLPKVVFCKGACMGCMYCKDKNTKKLILVVYHGSGTKIKTISGDITRQVKALFKQASNETIKASNFPPELKTAILASNYYHENEVLTKLLPYTTYVWNNKNKEWRLPMVDINSIYDFILELRGMIAEEEAKNPDRFKNALYYTKFKDPSTGKPDDKNNTKLKEFLALQQSKIEPKKQQYELWISSGENANLPTDEDSDEDIVEEALSLDNNKKIDFDKLSMQSMSNLAVANILHKIKSFVPENSMMRQLEDRGVTVPTGELDVEDSLTAEAPEAPDTPEVSNTEDVMRESYRVQKRIQRIINEGHKPVKLSDSEIANAGISTSYNGEKRRTTIIRRPDKIRGGFIVAIVNVDNGEVIDSQHVDTKEQTPIAIKSLNRSMDKFYGLGGKMADSGRHRNKPHNKGAL